MTVTAVSLRAFNSRVSGPSRRQESKTQQHYYRKLLGCYLRHPEPWSTINQRVFDSDIVQVLSITFMSLPPSHGGSDLGSRPSLSSSSGGFFFSPLMPSLTSHISGRPPMRIH